MISLPLTLIAASALSLEVCLWRLAHTPIVMDAASAGVVHGIRLSILSYLFYILSAVLAARFNPFRTNRLILAAALVFRLTMAPARPGFSDDVFRYRWDGRVQAEGGNPYLLTPETARRDMTYARTPAPDVRSGYGPVTTMLSRGAYAVARAVTADPFLQAAWMKLPAALCELATLALLAGDLTPARFLLYAWSPVPVIEFWWNGHNDAIALLFLTGALALVRTGRWGWAHVALGLAIASKWWPAALWPLFAGSDTGSRRFRLAWLEPVVVAICALPYRPPDWNALVLNARFMSGFVGGWRNNDSLHGLLLALTGDQYLAKYLAFSLMAAAAAWLVWRRWPLERACLALIAVLLLVSANCHPWYLTWFVPLLPFAAWPPVFVWQLLMPLAYTVLAAWYERGVWNGVTSIRWWIYVPVFAAIVREGVSHYALGRHCSRGGGVR